MLLNNTLTYYLSNNFICYYVDDKFYHSTSYKTVPKFTIEIHYLSPAGAM